MVWLFIVAPVVALFICLLFNNGLVDVRDKLAWIKYVSYLPIFFYYAPLCYRNPRRVKDLLPEIKAGDILLTRQSNYLDGLLFAQNSYFTHAGIVSRDKESNELKIIHAISKGGVCYSDIERAFTCDAYALLRFTDDKSRIERRLQKAKTVKKFLRNLDRDELAAYKNFINALPKTGEDFACDLTACIDYIENKASLLVGRAYDEEFDFNKFDKLSCVEFVWLCYNCLSPLHQIKTKPFFFFRWARKLVIVPDMFISSAFFDVKYESLENISGESQLEEFVRNNLLSFWLFACKVYGSLGIIMIFLYLLKFFPG